MNPLRVAVADDEAAARHILKRHLGSIGQSVEIVGEASNGQELLSLLHTVTPDVLLLDIMMPGATGLEVLRQLDSQETRPKVLIVSAHDRFDFAREAMSLGVFDYLVKPVRPTELAASLSRCAGQIALEQQKEASYSSLLRRVEVAGDVVRSTLLSDMLVGARPTLNDIALWNRLEFLDVEGLKAMIVADIPLDQSDRARQLVSAWADSHESVWCMPGGGRVVTLPASQDAWNAASLGRLARGFLAYLSDALSHDQPATVRVAYVGPTTTGPDLERQYEAACHALNRAYVSGKPLVRATPEEVLPERAPDSLFDLESKLAAEVKSGSPQTALSLLKALIEEVAALPAPGHESLGFELVAVVSQACRVAGESTGQSGAMLDLRNATVAGLIRAGSTDSMVRIAKECLECIFRHLEVGETAGQRLVSAAKTIVEQRASEDLTLTEVASLVFVSPYYLSRLFKAKCGMNFQDYLTEVRIDKAKALLRDTDVPCRVVGQSVGYSSASYFSQIFKRRTGKSPAQFRESTLQH